MLGPNGREGGYTIHYPRQGRAADLRRGDEYRTGKGAAGDLRRRRIQQRLLARLGGEGRSLGDQGGDHGGFERIHRSNLVGMGVVPFTLQEGTSWASLDLKGDESRSPSTAWPTSSRAQMMEAEITYTDGSVKKVLILCRIDAALDEIDYFKNAGILHYVLRGLAA